MGDSMGKRIRSKRSLNEFLSRFKLGRTHETRAAALRVSRHATPPFPQPMRARRRRPPIGCPLEAVLNQEQIRLTVDKVKGWESHLTMVNSIAGGRAGDEFSRWMVQHEKWHHLQPKSPTKMPTKSKTLTL